MSDLKGRKILVVDDDEANRDLISSALIAENAEVRTAYNGRNCLEVLNGWMPDLVLMDYHMPEMTGLEALRKLRKLKIPVDVMFISAHGGTVVTEALDAGADDYIKKPFSFAELLARVRVRFRIRDLQRELEAANNRLYDLSLRDDLTGLFNMRAMYDRIDHELARARRGKGQVACVMMDMDYFKTVNDGHDHLFGSFVLKEVGRLLTESLREADFAARYGGDEFLLVLTDTSEEGTKIFCDRFLGVVRNHVFKDDQDIIRLTASLGYSLSPVDGDTSARELVRVADHALYQAKESGRNRVFGFSGDEAAKKTHEMRRRKQAA